jgi:ferredoxin
MDAVRDVSQLPFGPGGTRLHAGVQAGLKVWIDQDLCTGDGLCTDHAPSVFRLLEDGIAYVVEDGQVLHDPGGSVQLAVVPSAEEENVVHAAAECPGECIFIELDDTPELEP